MQCMVVSGKKVVAGIIQIMKVFSVNVRNYGFCPPHSDWIHWIRQKRLWWGAFCRWRAPTRSVPSCSSIRQSLNAQLPWTQYTWCELLNHGQASNVSVTEKAECDLLEVLCGQQLQKEGAVILSADTYKALLLFLLAPTGALIAIMVYYIRGGSSSSHFFRFSLRPSMQLMLQVSF